ncbi:hypothetical protein ACFLVG_00125 [Chloroflexota bacterium]
MEGVQLEQERPKRNWRLYLISSLSFLFVIMAVVAAVYFREELRYVQGYGYVGAFFVGILCGVTIIPAPTLLLVFTLGGVLKPVYVGLASGLGGAIGGITIYLTGAGVGTVWTKLRSREWPLEYRPSQSYPLSESARSKFWIKGQDLYNHLVNWIGGKGGAWTLFITSAMIISPFYFAGLAAGSLRMGLIKFFLISWAGKTVRYLIVAYAGYWGLRFLLPWIGY